LTINAMPLCADPSLPYRSWPLLAQPSTRHT